MSDRLDDRVADERSTSGRPDTVCQHPPGESTHRSGRAVSYALGFVLVFSVVVAGTLALFAVGVDVLADVDRDEALAANEEAVKIIHSELNDVAAQGGARREMALELVDAQLHLSESREVRVRVESEALEESLSYDSHSLLYEVPEYGATFVYALGHVHRVDGADQTARSELLPAFETSGERTRLVVPVVTRATAESPDSVAVSGTGERTVVAHRLAPPVTVTRTGTDADGVTAVNGSVTVEGAVHPSVWVSAFEAAGFGTVSTGPNGSVTGRFETERLSVLSVEIAVALDGAGGEP